MSGDRGRLPAGGPLPVLAAAFGGIALAVQGVINGGLAARIGSPVLAGLVSNGSASMVLLVAAATLGPTRAGLRRLWTERPPWWQYLGGFCGALFVAGSAITIPVLGVALVSVVQICGTSVGGILVDRIGLSPSGRMPVSVVRVGSALLAVVAVAVAQLGRPVGRLAVGLLALVLAFGLGAAVQAALNGRLNATARNVAAASLVNALVGTAVLGAVGAGLGVAGRLPSPRWPGDWWLYLGGMLSLVIVGTNLYAVRRLGVLRTGLIMVAGQLAGALVLDAVLPGAARPTGWLLLGVLLTALAALLSGVALHRPGTPTRLPAGRRPGADSKT